MTTLSLSNILQGGSGYARRITFEQIILSNVKNPIIIDQGYKVSPRVRISLYITIHIIISCHFNIGLFTVDWFYTS